MNGDPSLLLSAFRSHLAAASLVREPGTGTANIPPLWLEPPEGAIAPGEKRGIENHDRLVLSAFMVAGPPAGAFDAWRRQHIIDLRIRTVGTGGVQVATDYDARIREAIIGHGVAPAINFLMGDLRIIQAREYTALQRVGATPGQGWTYRHQFLFEVYADQ